MQNSNNDSNEIKLPEQVLKQLEELERKAQQEANDAFAREMAQKAPEERDELEQEMKRLKETKFAPETRTEAELEQEDERAIKIFNELKAKRKSSEER